MIKSYELAFRMQNSLPKLFDLTKESKATLDAYGVGTEPTDDFGRQCLLARRAVESGVRFVEITHTGWDHQVDGFTMWLAGGGVEGGVSYGSTDEYGQKIADGKAHIHDLNATILHLLGLDHVQLTYRYSGRDFRLTDVFGRVIEPIIA